MPGVAYSDFDSLEDVLATDRFEVLIEPPSQSGTNQTLAIRCQQMVVPEEMIEPMLVSIHGMEFSYRGRRTYDKAIGATFIETTDAQLTKAIRAWMQDVVGGESHNGKKKKEYVTVGTLNILDQSGNVAKTYEVDNLWPSQVPQIQLDGSNASPMLVQVTFTFDRMRQNGVQIM